MFEQITGSISNRSILAIEEAEAARLIFGHVRDVAESLESMKTNPLAMIVGENCWVRWNPKNAEICVELV